MHKKDCLRYDAVQDRYQHLEDGKPGRFHNLTKHLASIIRKASKETRAKEPLDTGLSHGTGWTKFHPSIHPSHLIKE